MPMPSNERERLEALHACAILDTQPEPGFDDAAELAGQLCGAPVSYVTFIDETRAWLKAKCGLPPDFTECPREIAFCATTICGADLVHVPDLTRDTRFCQLPIVTGAPNFRFYCGMPLITDEGHALGTVCVADFEPRELSAAQREAMRRLGRQVVTQLTLRRQMIELATTLRERDEARDRTRELLLNLLPASIADELQREGHVQPRFFRSASILFTDFKDFTRLVERMEPAALIALLHQYFSSFDEIIGAAGLEKLKTIGDSYMAVAGVPAENKHHPVDAVLTALRLRAHLLRVNAQRERARLPVLQARFGIHTGPVIAGVVGRQKFTYDIWGDAVNVAARIEAAGEPMRINVSSGTAERLGNLFELEARGEIEVKGKGAIKMFFVNRIAEELAQGVDSVLPNDKFRSELERM
jgi:adenylate cyclase